MGRESSSYSATMLGEMLGASEVRIYTDVPGILTADPTLIPSARTLPHLDYATAHTLAELGAKVLHPRTVRPVERGGIPLVITTFGGASTVIDARGGDDGYSVVMLPEATLVSVETAAVNADMGPLVRALSSTVPVLWLHQFRRRVRIVTSRPVSGEERFDVMDGELRTTGLSDVAVVSLVRHRGISGEDLACFFTELRDRFPLAMQGGIDARAISVALPPEDAGDIVRRLHDRFVG
jgi:aspartate kinase